MNNIENVINEISNFCNRRNIEFKYCKDLKTDSYIFRFSKNMKEIQMELTSTELVEASFTSTIIQRIQDKIN